LTGLNSDTRRPYAALSDRVFTHIAGFPDFIRHKNGETYLILYLHSPAVAGGATIPSVFQNSESK